MSKKLSIAEQHLAALPKIQYYFIDSLNNRVNVIPLGSMLKGRFFICALEANLDEHRTLAVERLKYEVKDL